MKTEDEKPFHPVMLDATCIQTTCPEVSGLCLAPAGDGLLVGNQWKPVILMRFSPEDGVLSRRELTFTTEIADLCYDSVRDVLWIADSESHILRLCTPEGDQLATYPMPFADNGEGICVDHGHHCIWIGDDTTSRIYQVRFKDL